MAERGVSDISTKAEQTPIKKKRNFARRIVDRSRKSQSARRACTPEPGLKVWTDESEKDASDAENVAKSKEITRRRTRSAERAQTDEPDTEEDFEIIRSLHKSKELEEESKPTIEVTVRPKEEPKIAKEMPPLIVAPAELKKRARHKSQLITELNRKLVSTSEEEEDAAKQVPKPRKSTETRKHRRVVRKEKTEPSDSEGKFSDKTHGEENDSDAVGERPVVPPVDLTPAIEKGVKTWFWWGKKNEKEGKKVEKDREKRAEVERPQKRPWLLVRIAQEWKFHVQLHRVECHRIKTLKNRCLSHLLLVMMYCGFGGMVFRFVEGAFETFYKCGVKRVKRDFIDTLWSYSQYMLEEDWKSQARRKLMDFENQLHAAHEAGMTTYSGQKSWSFLNSVVYCLTVITTIGYGHISPSTTTGRAITIIYAIFGIPMFLILLADFGKLFTRGIKFLWAFVRRLYYTGSCKKVRRTAPVQEMMKGVQFMYDFAKNRRPSQWGIDEHQQSREHNQLPVAEGNVGALPETPDTPNMSAFEIDDEFNLPISVAITILIIYIFVGATIYWMWEEWSFFESFYFVFISMSTIGFGDFVPQNPVYMMASIIYLVFGLALTSMCINVVQEKLSDTFRQASTKIGATIGLRVAEDGTISAPPELADVNPMQNLQ